MRPIAKFELIKYLKTVEAVTALVGQRIYSRYVESDKVLPSLALVKSSETRDYMHSGDSALVRSTISITVFAATDYDVENVKDAIIVALHAQSIQLGASDASIELIEDIDVMDEGLIDSGILAGSLDFLIQWEI